MSVAPGRSTPMLRQYFEMKSQAQDAILFYRMGDVYEMFFEDAREAAPLLGIALTARHKDSDIEAPMCGVPHHSADHHIARLVAAGRKVAICDQVEDPRSAKGLVRRAITRIVTPGTVLDPESLSPGAPSYLCALIPAEPQWSFACLDLSTGRFHAGTGEPRRMPDLLALFRPREVLLPEDAKPPSFAGAAVTRRGTAWFGKSLAGSDKFKTPGSPAAAAAFLYAQEMRPNGVGHLGPPEPLRFGERMGLDASAIATLEIFESSDGDPSRSLYAVLDRTRSPMGARALREALARPSKDPIELSQRWDAVEELVGQPETRRMLQDALGRVGDLERRFARISVRLAGPLEVAAGAEGLAAVPNVQASGATLKSSRLRDLLDGIPSVGDLVERVRRSLADAPPVLVSAGGAIREGADAELDSL